MSESVMLEVPGRSPATLPGYHARKTPRAPYFALAKPKPRRRRPTYAPRPQRKRSPDAVHSDHGPQGPGWPGASLAPRAVPRP